MRAGIPMGMAGPDVVLLVAGFVLVAGSGYALYQMGGADALGGGSPTSVYTVTYATAAQELASEPVTFQPPSTTEVEIDAYNVTKLTFEVRCADPVPGVPNAQFNIRIDVTPPENASVEAPDPVFGICGQDILVEVPIADAPTGSAAAQGASEEEARAALPRDGGARGTWTVALQGARAGGQLPVGPPVGNPTGTLVVTADVYEAQLAPLVR